MEKKMTVGPKGQIVIPKDIRDKIGIKEYSEVIVDTVGDSVIIKKLKPASVTYVDYYCATYSKKLNKRVDIKKLTEEQYERNILH
jgi:AbrB family looped-hinge helix DNA binding protein